jgi:hypothetical protein
LFNNSLLLLFAVFVLVLKFMRLKQMQAWWLPGGAVLQGGNMAANARAAGPQPEAWRRVPSRGVAAAGAHEGLEVQSLIEAEAYDENEQHQGNVIYELVGAVSDDVDKGKTWWGHAWAIKGDYYRHWHGRTFGTLNKRKNPTLLHFCMRKLSTFQEGTHNAKLAVHVDAYRLLPALNCLTVDWLLPASKSRILNRLGVHLENALRTARDQEEQGGKGEVREASAAARGEGSPSVPLLWFALALKVFGGLLPLLVLERHILLGWPSMSKTRRP